jgi:hypothetical protein
MNAASGYNGILKSSWLVGVKTEAPSPIFPQDHIFLPLSMPNKIPPLFSHSHHWGDFANNDLILIDLFTISSE